MSIFYDGTNGIADWLTNASNPNYAANHAALVTFEKSTNTADTSIDFSTALSTFIQAVQGPSGETYTAVTFNETSIDYTHSVNGAGSDDVDSVNVQLDDLFSALLSTYLSLQLGTTRNDVLSGSFIEKVFTAIAAAWPLWFKSDDRDYSDYFKDKFGTSPITVVPFDASQTNILVSGGKLIGVDVGDGGYGDSAAIEFISSHFIQSVISKATVKFGSIKDSSIEAGWITRCMVIGSDLDLSAGGNIYWTNNLVKEVYSTSGAGHIYEYDNGTPVEITFNDVLDSAL